MSRIVVFHRLITLCLTFSEIRQLISGLQSFVDKEDLHDESRPEKDVPEIEALDAPVSGTVFAEEEGTPELAEVRSTPLKGQRKNKSRSKFPKGARGR